MPAVTVDRRLMRRALALAAAAGRAGEVPVAAVVARDGEILAEARNRTEGDADPTAHAEVLALRAAARRLGNCRLDGTTLYTTLEPCAMCAGALVWARVRRVVIAAADPKSGAAGSLLTVIPHPRLNHRPQVEFGLLAEESVALLKRFFRARRKRAEGEVKRRRRRTIHDARSTLHDRR